MKSQVWRKKLSSALVYLVVAIGMLNVTGHLTGVHLLRRLGQLSGASPLPLVYGQSSGYEYWASKYEFEFIFKDRQALHLIADPNLYSQIAGPHVVRVALQIPLGAMPFMAERFWKHPLQSALCNHGRLARDWKIDGELRQVDFTITSKTAGQQTVWKRTVECSN